MRSPAPTPVDEFLRLTPAKVAAAIGRIVALCRPQAIFAFGSRARGQARADSDLDLCVLLPVPAPAPDRDDLRRRLRSHLADLPFAKDLLVSDPEHFARWRAHPNSVYRDVAEEGVVLWCDGQLDGAAAQRLCGVPPAQPAA